MLTGMENVSHEQAYRQMRRMLNEKQWRQYLAVEAQQRASLSVVAQEAGVSLNTVKRGLKELEAGVDRGALLDPDLDETLLAVQADEIHVASGSAASVWESKQASHV